MIPSNNTTHSIENLQMIDRELSALGVNDYRFCIENDCYVCDKYGNFFSVCRRLIRNGKKISSYRVLPIRGTVEDGYVTMRITINNVRKHLRAHRMMMNAWIGNKPGLVVNHIDGNKLNNALSNLEWCTIAENNAHAIKIGLYDPGSLKKFTYKIPFADWMTIYVLNKHLGFSFRELGRMNRCSRSTIEKICRKIDGIMPKEVLNGN